MSKPMEKATPAEPGHGSLILKGGIAVAVGSAAFLVKYLFNRDTYEGMESIVSFSSRMIAAARALEDDEESKVTFDPLAKFMAGTKAIGRARKRRVKAPEGSGRQYKVGRIAVRTRWFDDQLEECLGMPRTFSPSEDARHIVATLVPGADEKMHLPTQVVELGAGLSTRPWRLHLPAVLKWFDVDRQDVIDMRENLLIKHGAEVDMMSPIRRSESKNSILERQIGTLDHHSVNVEFPLRCESRTSVAADVGNPEWIKALMAAGFDASKPTVWIAEGLLMYLEPARVDALLREIASMSAGGSCFLTGVVTERCITNLLEKKSINPLMKEWKSGVPQDPAPWLKSLGWNSRLVITRAEIAEALGLSPDICSFETIQEDVTKGFFIVATT